MKRSLVFLTVLLCAALLSAADKGAKEPPQGVKYVYIERATQDLIPAVLAKGMRVAFLFDAGQKEWLKTIVPTLKGTSPLVFVRGDLKPEETAELKKTLDHLEYEATVLHAKLTAGDGMGVVPVTKLLVIERVEDLDNKWVDFDLKGAADKPERGLLQDKKRDPQDFGTPFTVAGGMIFKRSKLCLVNIDRPGASLPKGMDLTVVFSADPEKMKKVLGL